MLYLDLQRILQQYSITIQIYAIVCFWKAEQMWNEINIGQLRNYVISLYLLILNYS